MRLIDADSLKIPSEEIIAKMTIELAPTIDPVKHGRWVKAEPDGCWSYAEVYKQCSECGKVTFLAERMNYCPNCGADMRGEEE